MPRLSKDQWEAWREHPVTVAVMEHLAAEGNRNLESFTHVAWEQADRLDDLDVRRELLTLRCRYEAMKYLTEIERKDIDGEPDGDLPADVPGSGAAGPD